MPRAIHPRRAVLIPQGNTYSYLPSQRAFDDISSVRIFVEGTLNLYTANFNTTYPGWPQPWAPLSFQSCVNLTMTSTTGQGVINGRGEEWWWYTIFVGDRRPNALLEIQSCLNFELSSVTFRNAPQYHTYLMDLVNASINNVTVMVDGQEQLPVHAYINGLPQSEELTVANVFDMGRIAAKAEADEAILTARKHRLPSARYRSSWWWNPTWEISPPLPLVYALNTDGLDVSGTRISVSNCSVTNFDDSVCVKPLLASGGNSAYNTSCSHAISISDITVTWGVGVTMGSVPPDVGNNCITDVTVQRVNFSQPLKAIHVKPNPPKPDSLARGTISNILYEDVSIQDAVWWAVYIAPQQQQQPGSSGTGCSFFSLSPTPHAQRTRKLPCPILRYVE